MDFLIVLAALCFLMFVAYRGYSVILFAPAAALGAVLLTDPVLVAPMFTGLFMEKMVGFLKLYFPVFLLGAVFGKLVELAGFSKSIVASVVHFAGPKHAIFSIVETCRRLHIDVRQYLLAILPGLSERPSSDLPKLTPAAWLASRPAVSPRRRRIWRGRVRVWRSPPRLCCNGPFVWIRPAPIKRGCCWIPGSWRQRRASWGCAVWRRS